MQSTEEYLDQLLASVSEDESAGNHDKKHKSMKPIEELDESELTEEVLQKQLALLLGLEQEDAEEPEQEDDFMSLYTSQIAEEGKDENDSEPVIADEIKDIPADEIIEIPTDEIDIAPAPQISETGVLSADEIAALFASMGNDDDAYSPEDTQEELIAALMNEEENEEVLETEMPVAEELVIEESVAEEPVIEEPAASVPQVSESGILSADEIAALFASMGAEEAVESEESVEEALLTAMIEEPVTEEIIDVSMEDNATLTREELEELGLGDIADVLVNAEAETIVEDVSSEAEEDEKEILDFDFDEEMLLDIENVDAMLEATAKLAEEEAPDDFASERQAEEDIMSMLTQFEEEGIQESIANEAESAKVAQMAVDMALEEPGESIPSELLEETSNGKKKKEKKQKVKKEKVKKEKPIKEKSDKPSIKDKLFAFMFEEENLEDSSELIDESGEIAATDDLLDAKPAKAKKEKASKKDKKAKKADKGSNARDENAAIEAELAEEDKKKAKKKKDKPAKEKKVKKVVIAEKTPAEVAAEKREARHSIGTKGIVATLLVCASLLGLILVGTYFLPKQLSLITARSAFYAGNYEEAAMRFKGQNLNESDQIMYKKANLLYGLEERYHQYEVYADRGMEKDGLNALLQGVVACNKEEILAGQLGIETEWNLAKQKFVKALQDNYGLDAESIETICALRNPDYTVAVENILSGRKYDDMSSYGGNTDANVEDEENSSQESEVSQEIIPEDDNLNLNPDEMEDLLPEEEAIIEQLQQENISQNEEEPDAVESGDNELYSGSVEDGEVNFVE